MKKIFTLTLFCFYFSTIFAQTEKGKVALSANSDAGILFGKNTVLVDSSLGQSKKFRTYNAKLGVSYFVANNLAIGISGSFQYSSNESSNPGIFYFNYTAGVIPSLTYFFPLKGKIKPNLSAGVGYVWYFTDILDAKGLSFNVAPTVSFFLSKKISFDLGAQYSFNNLKNKNWSSDSRLWQNSIGLLAGLTIYF